MQESESCFVKGVDAHEGHWYHNWHDHDPISIQINQFKSRCQPFLPSPSQTTIKKYTYERKRGCEKGREKIREEEGDGGEIRLNVHYITKKVN